MADIAFLLLIFFLVTTTIIQDQGLLIKLPPETNEIPPVKIHDRNLFTVSINSKDQVMVQGVVKEDIKTFKPEVKAFITNYGKKATLSEHPEKAVVSLKTNRGTSYSVFITVLDQIQAAYYEIYAEKVNMTAKEYRKLDPYDPEQKEVYQRGRAGIPMNISIAEPTN